MLFSTLKSPSFVSFSGRLNMAVFPEITSRDYAVRMNQHLLEQEPVSVPLYPFQFTSNYDFYRPCKFDFIYLDPPTNNHAVLRYDLAISLWETMRMKEHYILAAAHNWDGDTATHPLPASIPDSQFREIHMLPPVFHHHAPLSSIKLFKPASPTVIRAWVSIWQQYSRMLSAWIERARINSTHVPNCSWTWSITPADFIPYIPTANLFDSEDLASTTTESTSLSEEEVPPSLPPVEVPVIRVPAVQVHHANASIESVKRAHDSSPLDAQRDGGQANKKQLVLWHPSLAKLLEAQRALITGEVSTGHSLSNAPRTPLLSPAAGGQSNLCTTSVPSVSSPRDDPRLRTLDPRILANRTNRSHSQPPSPLDYLHHVNVAETSEK